MSLNITQDVPQDVPQDVTQDVPQDVTQDVPQDVTQQHVLDRYDQHIMILIQLRPQCGRYSQLGFLNLFLAQRRLSMDRHLS